MTLAPMLDDPSRSPSSPLVVVRSHAPSDAGAILIFPRRTDGTVRICGCLANVEQIEPGRDDERDGINLLSSLMVYRLGKQPTGNKVEQKGSPEVP